MAALSAEEIARYRRDGVLIPDHRVPAGRLAELRAALDEVLANNPDRRPEQLVSAHVSGTNKEGVRGHAAFLEIARDPDILDLVGQLIGQDIALWGCHIFCKPGGDGLEVPWHQDGHYWPIRPLATCTAWLALDDSTVANGCLRVIPGSQVSKTLHAHLREDRADLALNRAIDPALMDEAEAMDVELEAGQLSLHDVHIIHGSNPNRSDRRRAGVAIRFMPTTSHFDRGLFKPGAETGLHIDFATRPLWLLRGIDRCGRNDFTIGHDESVTA
ncbi:phytanoyl-CoA dioxygenase family protein [Pelagibius litoralis]|uniref:Phytanoyl-CoA dioxygenase family protein n=1 Tax=Pelagibius litoralis TaxID=374515 RepID=A0A967C8C9_9PROT|nr:phytanoyl-CoA dioxygenase family protein [Pelagibius litoralis]NIA68592.1 phytanoyl-CoA dioxygenase family protein [Pelagibius litoralis]